MKIKLLFLLIFTSHLIVQSNPAIKGKVFSPNEKQQIKEIIHIIDSLVMAETSSDSIEYAYHKYFEYILQAHFNDTIIANHKSVAIIVSQIEKKSVFKQIWKKEYVYNYKKNLGKEILILNHNGKYLKFLRKFSNKNRLFRDYYESIYKLSGIAPTNRGWFYNNYSRFNFDNPDIHFLISIHLLTIVY